MRFVLRHGFWCLSTAGFGSRVLTDTPLPTLQNRNPRRTSCPQAGPPITVKMPLRASERLRENTSLTKRCTWMYRGLIRRSLRRFRPSVWRVTPNMISPHTLERPN